LEDVSQKGPEPRDDETRLEQRLQAARPTPRPDFVESLEHRLLPSEPARRSRWRIPLAGAGVAGALATMLLAFALVGAKPFSSAGDDDVRARDGCRFVEQRVQVVLPDVAIDRRGEPQLRFVKRTVERQVKRCR